MKTQKDTIEYIGQISVNLSQMAQANDLGMLALLLDMVALEAGAPTIEGVQVAQYRPQRTERMH